MLKRIVMSLAILFLSFTLYACGGDDKKEIDEVVMRVNNGYVQWKMDSDSEWANLISLADLTGENGQNGEDGQNGADGIGIQSITINTNNELVITYTNGTNTNLGSVSGSDGQDGTDGISITDIQINEEGHLIITLSNDETIDAGLVVGKDGEDGQDGLDGQDGQDGLDGEDGIDGREIELSVNEGNIEWRYMGDEEWTSLMALEDLKGTDGTSAYDLYVSQYPNYQGTEEEWLDDLINGKLGLIENFDVTLELNGGSLPSDVDTVITAEKFETIQLPIPTRYGYEFLGWYTGETILDGKFIPVIPVVEDFTLYARWEEIPLEGITIEQDDFDLVIGNSTQLSFITDPIEVLLPEVIWSSSDNQIISVDETGVITAHQKGEVTITLTSVKGNFVDTIKVTAVDGTNPDLISVSPLPELQILEAGETFKWTVSVFDQYMYQLEVDHTLANLPEFSVYANALNPYGSDEAKTLFEDLGVFVTYDETTQTWEIDFGTDVTNAFILAEEVSFYIVIKDESGNQWGSMYDVTEENTFTYSFITLENYALNQVVNASNYDEMKEALLTYQGVFGFNADTMTMFNDLPVDQGRHQAIINAMLLGNESDYYASITDVKDLFEFVVFKEYTKHLFIRSVDAAENTEEMVVAFETYVPTLNGIRQFLISQGLTDLADTNYTTALYELDQFLSEQNTYVINFIANHVMEVRSVTHDGNFYSDVLITDAIRDALDSDYRLPELYAVAPRKDNLVIIEDSFVWTVIAFDENLYELEIDHTIGTLPEFSVYASESNPYGSEEAKALFEAQGVIVTYDSEIQTWTIDFGVAVTNEFITAEEVSFFLVIKDVNGNQWGSMYNVTEENTFTYSFISIEDYAMLQLALANDYMALKDVLLTHQDVFGFNTETMTKFNELPADQGRQQAIINAMLASKIGANTIQDVKALFEFIVDKEYTKHLFIRAVDAAETREEMIVAFETYVPTLNDIRQFLISEGWTELEGTNYTTALYDLNGFINEGNVYVVDYVANYLLDARSNTNDDHFYGVVAITDAIRNALDSDYTLPVFVGVTPNVEELVIIEDSFVWTIQAYDEYLYKLEIDHSLANLPEFSVYASEENPYGSLEAKALFDAQGVSVTYDAETQKWTIDFGVDVTNAFVEAETVSFYLVIEDESGNQWGSMYEVTEENTFTYAFIAIEDYVHGLVQDSENSEALMTLITENYEVIGISQEIMDDYNSISDTSNIDNLMFSALEIGHFSSLTRVNNMFTFLVNEELANNIQ